MKNVRYALAALLFVAASAAPALAETPTLLRPKEGEKFNDNVFIAVARTKAPQCSDGEWQIEWQVRQVGAKADDWQPWKYALRGVSCYVNEKSGIDMPPDLFDPSPVHYRVRVRLTWKGGEGEWSDWRHFEVVYRKGTKPPARN